MAQLNDSTDNGAVQVARLWRPNPGLSLIGCLLAAGLSFLVVNQIHPVSPFEDLPELGAYPSAELLSQYRTAEYAFQTVNSAVNGSILGAFIGLLVGALTAAKRGLGAIVGGLAGALAGGLGGYVAGTLVVGAIYQSTPPSLLQSVGYLSLIWGLIGAAVCGAMAAIHNRSQILTAVVTGALVATLGALLYNVVASILFPMSNLVYLTPKTMNERLVWAMCFGIALGVGIGFGFRNAQPAQPKADIEVA